YFFLVAEKNGTSATGWNHSANLHFDNGLAHDASLARRLYASRSELAGLVLIFKDSSPHPAAAFHLTGPWAALAGIFYAETFQRYRSTACLFLRWTLFLLSMASMQTSFWI